jgi:hypothetical protein
MSTPTPLHLDGKKIGHIVIRNNQRFVHHNYRRIKIGRLTMTWRHR